MSPEARARLDAHNAAQDDWRGQCQRCLRMLKGTLDQIRAHRCGEPDAAG